MEGSCSEYSILIIVVLAVALIVCLCKLSKAPSQERFLVSYKQGSGETEICPAGQAPFPMGDGISACFPTSCPSTARGMRTYAMRVADGYDM